MCCAAGVVLGLRGAQTRGFMGAAARSTVMPPSTVARLFCQLRGHKMETDGKEKTAIITCLRGTEVVVEA